MILLWTGALALSVLLYVLLDGFDLGVGIMFGLTRDETERRRMLASISPVWDGNETWLVLTAATMFGAFPRAYATLLSAFYLPMIFLLGALILRGVAFEFRYKTNRLRWLWDLGFVGGSTLAAFIQGMTVGALVQGLPFANGHYAGGAFTWLTPFSCLCGVGLCLGYALLGAAWLAGKSEGDLRNRAYRQLPVLMASVFAFLAVVFVYALAENLPIMHRWLERPYLLAFPALGAVAAVGLLVGVRRRIDNLPFPATALIFLAAFGTLGVSFWPYMIPYELTIAEAAAPPSSLAFMFWGAGVVVLPLILLYTATVYRVFRGKVSSAGGYH
ncbi:MAG: cytochrome d ubiquinol oxidase subunit II [Caulobacteraceae bacterium]